MNILASSRVYSCRVGQTAFRKAACGVRTLEQNENTPSAESASAGPPPWLVNDGPAQTYRLTGRAAQSATDLVKRAQAHRRSGLLGPPDKFLNDSG